MLTLFNKYKEAGNIPSAILIGRNLFNRNPSNREVFAAYFDFLCYLAETETVSSLDDRRQFAGQAGVTLEFYSENAEMNEELVGKISKWQERLVKISNCIIETERLKYEETHASIVTQNSANLIKLYELKKYLSRVSTQEEFDKILAEIGSIDGKLNKDTLTDEQSGDYESLTKEHTDLISSKMREFEHKKNVEYNKNAVNSFADAFKRFKNDESKYKNQTQLYSLASDTLFGYDASRLFNETLVYYNHVYSYIFSKLDDDGKLALTRFSIECERKLR